MSEFGKILDDIKNDLSKHTGRTRTELMTMYIKDRLNKSLETYYKELDNSFYYLQNKNAKSLYKKLSQGDDEE